MITYTFLFLSRDGSVSAVDSAECPDDAEALRVGPRLFIELAHMNFARDQRIEVYQGSRRLHPAQTVDACAF